MRTRFGKWMAMACLMLLLSGCAGYQIVKTPEPQDGEVLHLEDMLSKSGANVVRAFTCLTGGTTGCLDKIPYGSITAGDIAMVVTGNVIYFYQWNASDPGDASSPTYICPTNDSNCTNGAWYLVDVRAKGLNTGSSQTPAIDFYDADASSGAVLNGRIYLNCTTTTASSEVCSLYFQTQNAGTLATRLSIDTANDLIDTTMKIRGAIPIVAATGATTNITAAQALGSIVFASYAGGTAINLPDYTAAAAADKAKIGSSVCVYASVAQVLTVDVAADDKIRLGGTLGAAGVAVTSDGAAGDFSCFVLTDASSDVGHWTVFGYGKTDWQ